MQFLPLYLTLFGASTMEMALLPVGAAITGLVALGPGAMLARRVASPKRVVLLGGGGGARVLLALMALSPLLFQGRALIYVIVGLMALRNFISSLAHPAWVTVFASVIPAKRVAGYTAMRNFWVSVVAAGLFPVVGLIVDRGGSGSYPLVIGAATVIGLLSTACYALIREPARHGAAMAAPTAEAESPMPAASIAPDERPTRFLVMCLLLHTATMIATPYLVLHLSRNLGASPATIGLLSTLAASATVCGQLGARWLTARFDSRRLLVLALATLPVAPATWALVQEPWQAAIPFTISGLGWALTHVLCFDLMLKLSRGGSLPATAAQQQATVLLGALAGPPIGAWLSSVVGMHAVFGVSAGLTVCAASVFMLPSLASLRALAQRKPAEGLARLNAPPV